MHPFAHIVAALRAAHAEKGFVFVGLSGLGNSGKTYTSLRLAEAIPELRIIHIDDFYKPSHQREESHASEQIISTCFDWDRLEQQVFDVIDRKEHMLKYNIYDWERNVVDRCAAVPLKGIVMLEGLYAFQERFAHRYDIKIWVDTPVEQRDVRAKKRYSPVFLYNWETIWKAQDDRYIETERPHDLADFVLYNY